MTVRRTRWLRWMLLLVCVLMAPIAHAAVRSQGPPAGWQDAPADSEAEERATGWAEALGGNLLEAYASRAADEYAETLAVISISGAMVVDASLLPERALTDAVGPLFETEPSFPRFREHRSGASLVTGVWEEDDATYDVAVASVGPNQVVVVLAVQSTEASLYARVFDEFLAEVAGLAPPVSIYDAKPLRWATLLGGLAIVIMTWILVANSKVGEEGATAIGRYVALVCIAVGMLGAVAVYVSLAGSVVPLRLANLSRARMAVEVAGLGVVFGLVAWIVGAIRDSTVRRVASAPTGGTFSGGSRTLSPNLVPPSRPAALTDPGHGMSPEALDDADRQAMKDAKRKPQATLVGAPSLASASSRDAEEFDRVWAAAQASEVGEVEVVAPQPAEPSPAPPKKPENTLVGRAPGPDVPEPRKQTKTKTEALQFPPPMQRKPK